MKRIVITSVTVTRIGGHDHVGVWVDHAKAGTLLVTAGDGQALKDLLRSTQVVIGRGGGGRGQYGGHCGGLDARVNQSDDDETEGTR
jgi:hypothetical protein